MIHATLSSSARPFPHMPGTVVALLFMLIISACGGFVPQPQPTPARGLPTFTPTLRPTPRATVTPTPPPAVQALYLTLTPTATPTPILPTATPTPYPGLIQMGKLARVIAPTGLNVREAPSPNAKRLGNFPPNAVVKVTDGPLEAEGYIWWQVDNEYGLAGWVAGGDGEDIWLTGELGEKRPVNRPVRLGDVVMVTTANGRNLSVRYEPGVRGLLIKRVVAGTHLQVIDGPVILDNVRWWKVQRADGLTGWAAEGSKRERWLSPLE
ncbi:MAG TPA: SH3 domain-containing protein [Anaerolineae bacterium]|nr:SH3 domain-containing protein [Caldilineae bacterium]HID35333.1 SH3 domain-containing protein [Anaerolineae bacterium]